MQGEDIHVHGGCLDTFEWHFEDATGPLRQGLLAFSSVTLKQIAFKYSNWCSAAHSVDMNLDLRLSLRAYYVSPGSDIRRLSTGELFVCASEMLS